MVYITYIYHKNPPNGGKYTIPWMIWDILVDFYGFPFVTSNIVPWIKPNNPMAQTTIRCIMRFRGDILKNIFTLPKFNSSPLKNDGWKTILSFWDGKFSGAMLNFQGVTWRYFGSWYVLKFGWKEHDEKQKDYRSFLKKNHSRKNHQNTKLCQIPFPSAACSPPTLGVSCRSIYNAIGAPCPSIYKDHRGPPYCIGSQDVFSLIGDQQSSL